MRNPANGVHGANQFESAVNLEKKLFQQDKQPQTTVNSINTCHRLNSDLCTRHEFPGQCIDFNQLTGF